MFKKPILVTHVHEVKLDGVDESAERVLDRLSHMMKTAGIALAIGIPSVILFGVLANVAGDAITNNLTNSQ